MPEAFHSARRLSLPLAATIFILGLPATVSATTVDCQVNYGGAIENIVIQPTDNPYTVPTRAIGSFYLFRVVLRETPAELAGVRIYTYANLERGPQLIHEASYGLDAPIAPANGFTGQQIVYEPAGDAELQYWCTRRLP